MGEKKTRDNESAWHPSCLTDQIVGRGAFPIKDCQGSPVLPNKSVNLRIMYMGKRFGVAVLSILISGLKVLVNLLGMSISYLRGKEWKLVGIDPILGDTNSEKDEATKRDIYVVDNHPTHIWFTLGFVES